LCEQADLCVIWSKAECEQAAKFLGLEQTAPQQITQKSSLGGCSFTADKKLIFNSRTFKNQSPVQTGNRNVCALCPTTTPPPRTTTTVVRTEAPKTTPPKRTEDPDDNVQSERTSSSSRGGSHFFTKLGQGLCATSNSGGVAYCSFPINDCRTKCNLDSGCYGYVNKKSSKGRHECRTYTSTSKETCEKNGANGYVTGATSRTIGSAIKNKNFHDCIVKCGTRFSYFPVCGDSFGGITTTIKGQWKAPVVLLQTDGQPTCRANGCTIESIQECEKAAKELKLKSTKPQAVSQKKAPYGCRLDTVGDTKLLRFNSKGRNVKNYKGSGHHLLCSVCAPAPAPMRAQKNKMS
jgi:hypothetical protein